MLVRIIGGHGGVSPGFRATSYLIDGKLLIDAGSVASGIQIEEQEHIENILISHSHLDHISDLAFLADNCFGLKKVPFQVFSSKKVKDSIKNHLLNNEIWPDFSELPSKLNPTLNFNILENEKWFKIGDYDVLPISVNHQIGSFGFIVQKKNVAILFTQDTGPTEKIWEYAKKNPNLKAIFTETSFPNSMREIAKVSQHHTPETIKEEILKMPPLIPIFLGHLKPNFQHQLFTEIDELKNERITILSSSDTSYFF